MQFRGSIQVRENEVGKTTISVFDLQKTVFFGCSKSGNQRQASLSAMRKDDAFIYESRRSFEVPVFKLPDMQDILEVHN